MGRPQKKPDYNVGQINHEYLESVSKAYKEVVEKNKKSSCPLDSDSYQLIAEEAKQFKVSPMKMRKLLITAGVYATDTSRLIARLDAEGKTQAEISDITGLKRASINGYLPYKKVIYKNTESSVGADRIRLMRERKVSCKNLVIAISAVTNSYGNGILDCNENIFSGLDEMLWNVLLRHENFAFTTARGLKFKYTIKGGELFVNRKENSKSLTKSSIFMAFHNAIRLQCQDGFVKGPKKLGTFGASYLYAIFMKVGIITDKPVHAVDGLADNEEDGQVMTNTDDKKN